MKFLIISDAWHPQINGVVRTLEMTVKELAELGHETRIVGPDGRKSFTFAMPFYPEIKLEFLAQSAILCSPRLALGSIVRDADRSKDIVDRVRDHIKKAPPRNELFDLNEAIDEVIVMVRDAMDRNRISVRTRLMQGMISVRGDRVQLQQVVLNLILNSVEAMS